MTVGGELFTGIIADRGNPNGAIDKEIEIGSASDTVVCMQEYEHGQMMMISLLLQATVRPVASLPRILSSTFRLSFPEPAGLVHRKLQLLSQLLVRFVLG